MLSVKNIQELYGYKFADIRFRMLDYPEQKEIEAKIILNTLTSNTASLSFEEDRKFFNEVMQDYEDEKSRRKKNRIS